MECRDIRKSYRAVCAAVAATLVVAGTLATVSLTAHAEPGFPNRPVRIFVPFGPGGVGDLTMRVLAQKLSERLKQNFIIENKPGAGGVLAAKAMLDNPPDGYNMLVTGNGTAISMSLFKNRPYHALTDFSPVSITATFEMLIGTRADGPFKTLKDLVETAKKNPGKLNFGAVNPGSTQNLSAHLLKQITGIDVVIVPYKTTPELVTAILRGDVDVGFDFYAGFNASITDKKMRILASSDEQRNPLLPDVPTAKEQGFPDYVVTSWNALSTPAGLPADVLKILNTEINIALAEPDVQARARQLGLNAKGSTPEEMRARMVRDIARWGQVIEKAKIEKQ